MMTAAPLPVCPPGSLLPSEGFAPPLTTEADLEDPARAAAIDAFWSGVGRFGHFPGNGGLSLACAAFVRPDLRHERGAIVVVNGRTESLVKYPEVAYDLWRQGWSVHLYDHRGQGLSQREPAVATADPKRGHVGRFDDYVDDLRTFIRTQVLPAGHSRHCLLAHSMGGAVSALLLEAPGPEQTLFRAAALCSPMLAIAAPWGGPIGGWLCRAAGAVGAIGTAAWSAGPGSYSAEPFEGNPFTRSRIRYARWRAAYEREPTVQLGAPTIGWLGAACEAGGRARKGADRIRVPVLVLVAGADTIVHASGIDAFCAGFGRAAPGGVARMTIEGARHELLIENDEARSRALGAVLGFFERHAGG